jgi:hypothetical protein
VIHIIGKGNGEAVVFDEESPPPKQAEAMAEADFWDAAIGEDDLRPAGSNAAPPEAR